MVFRNHFSKIIPFLIAATLFVFNVFHVLYANINIVQRGLYYGLIDEVIYGGVGLSIVLLMLLLRWEYWKVVFLGVIILAFTPVLQFYNQTLTLGVGALHIEMTALILLALHLGINPDTLYLIKKMFVPDEKDCKEAKERRIQEFEQKFGARSSHELEQIMNDTDRIPEAIEAARRVLARKNDWESL